ncbi:MAG: class I SAM-dependent methyltransferase [Acidobacteria bacterium]|nr:class I SAM-dependent methyltransferase [Acidobacteriota bacterium]MCA1610326.1 class I SAM-dependent methyltransferase [Acidobacteriota bacterium]MCA1617377.1 class I SAM-dependent methyltransferase [Acidobacteriota bacterium]
MTDSGVGAFDRDAAHNRGYLYTTNAKLSSELANRRLTSAALESADFKGKRILDVGCGDGTYTMDLLRDGRPASIYGFDPAREAIALAAQKGAGKPVTFAAHDAYSVPLPDDSFDIAHLRGVLHHLERPIDALREALRLAPVLIVLEPNGYNPILKCIEKLSRYHREHGEKSYAPAALDRWVEGLGAAVRARRFVGLVPFFCPDAVARGLKALEPALERTPLLRSAGCAVYVQVAQRGE